MGRLDDAAKHKVVELRKAGLSFRKIKAVLELENIKVSAQAIYLFLREFHGRPPGRVRPLEAGSTSSPTPPQVQPRTGTTREQWSNVLLQNLRGEASHSAGFTGTQNFAKQTSISSDTSTKPGCGEIIESSSVEQQHGGDKEENDIQIVSVTSLAQNRQQINLQSTVTRAEVTPGSPALTSAAFMRRRITPSPATNSMLAARKRLLDKALSHKMKQAASLLRRDHFSGDLRRTVSQPSETYDLTNEQTVVESHPGQNSAPRWFITQRPGLSVRSPNPLPRVGVHLPNRSPSPLPSSVPGVAVIRLQTPRGQGAPRSEGNPSQPQQAVQEICGLQDQIQTLSSEVHSLGLALKMLVEQQCRLEREQAQQTHIQKQILSTLQSFASKLGSCSNVQQHHSKTPSPSSLPVASASISNNFNFSRGTYTQCSQTQPTYNSLESLENLETFKLPELSPASINGFPPCSNSENVPLSHTPPQTQPYATTFPPNSHALLSPYPQPYVPTYSEAHPQTFKGPESKAADFPSSCSARTLQDCSRSTQRQDPQINTVKVEGP